jgi:type II secretory pathway predicted ATPase ExeA
MEQERRARAFLPNSDPTFLWLGGRRRETVEILKAAIVDGHPVAVLTGDAGVGKTMLAHSVADDLEQAGNLVGRLAHPSRDADDFRQGVAAAFQLDWDGTSREAFAPRFAVLVRHAAATFTHVLLVLDEAQAFTSDVLAEIAWLSDTARQASPCDPNPLMILVVGGDGLNLLIERPENASLARHITLRRRLAPLDERDVASYIRHRLDVAGARTDLVTDDAVRAISGLSHGIPRLINVVCSRAAAMATLVDAAIVDRSARDLPWLGSGTPRVSSAVAPPPVTVAAPRHAGRFALWKKSAVAIGLALTLVADSPASWRQGPAYGEGGLGESAMQVRPAGFADVLRRGANRPLVVETEASVMATIEAESAPALLSPHTAPTPRPMRKEQARRPPITPTPLHERTETPPSREAAATVHERPRDLTDTPDPRAIIDWLLGKRSPATDTDSPATDTDASRAPTR